MSWSEDSNKEFKSLKKAIGEKSNVASLAETCVCFANAQGGTLVIGIEDKESAPPSEQRIVVSDMNKVMSRLRDLTDGVAMVNPEILQHRNGGQYFIIKILPSSRLIATTASGKVLIRVSDNCYPVKSEELTNLAAEKNAFQWELVLSNVQSLNDADENQIAFFTTKIRESKRVSQFIREKSNLEILEFYQFVDETGTLTNLGVLWLGTPQQRARLSYPITFQYLVYNSRHEKIRERKWHFHIYNPMELLLEIEREAVELTYTSDLSHGLFKDPIRKYPFEVIRELLINAIAHKRYTTSGDIFLKVYPDEFTISNPGGLPLGITKDNILHEQRPRNPHLIKSLYDLSLMEGEGAGYDLIYEKLSQNAKPFPQIESSLSKITVKVSSTVISDEAIAVNQYINKRYHLRQKEIITLGIISSEKKILATKLAKKLQLAPDAKLKVWLGSLIEKDIVITRGRKKGTEYLLNPEVFSNAKLGLAPSLKTVEPHILEALITEDLKYNGESSRTEVQDRLKSANPKDIQKTIYQMVEQGKLLTKGAKRNRTYQLIKKINQK